MFSLNLGCFLRVSFNDWSELWLRRFLFYFIAILSTFLSKTFSHFPIFPLGFHPISTNFPCDLINTNCHLCTTSPRKDVNRSNDFRQMSVAIILTNGEKTNEAREEKASKNQHQRKLSSVYRYSVCAACVRSLTGENRCFVFSPLNRILPTLVRLLGLALSYEWISWSASRKDSHKGWAARRRKARFPIWRRRQFISQLTNLPSFFAVPARSLLKRGAFNCHDCISQINKLWDCFNHWCYCWFSSSSCCGVAGVTAWTGVIERNREALECWLWKSVIILIKCDLFSFVNTKEKFKRDQKGFGIVWKAWLDGRKSFFFPWIQKTLKVFKI